MNRREFLYWQIGAAALTLSGSMIGRPVRALAADPPDLALVKGAPDAATRKAVDMLGGMSSFVRPGDKVVIKPNMSFDQPPEAGTNTHPAVVQALAGLCSQAGASRISVLDHTLRGAEMCLEKSGIREASRGIEGCQIDTRSAPAQFKKVDIPEGKQLRSTEVMQEVLAADVLIAAPVAKHHSSTGVSLSLKGMMGLIYNRSEMHWKYDLHASIVDLCTLLQADLTVIDASRALTENGPSGPGKVVNLNTIVASRDMVAADAKVVELVQWYGRSIPAAKVKHIRLAHERGLGRMDLGSLRQKSAQV